MYLERSRICKNRLPLSPQASLKPNHKLTKNKLKEDKQRIQKYQSNLNTRAKTSSPIVKPLLLSMPSPTLLEKVVVMLSESIINQKVKIVIQIKESPQLSNFLQCKTKRTIIWLLRRTSRPQPPSPNLSYSSPKVTMWWYQKTICCNYRNRIKSRVVA